ncbi:FAD-dependent oxidoreductase [Streptomyces qinglanensis]|uniref:2-polyprenyl-6-methoxyphenol hydroxylase n=1 Tax=Streptomyces qinglanensis TaxID=943816 RepID=A0A1H9Q7E8_9ACTN|nr:FAD-dependent oxidoreductase [Streptomyces qinglanensis]SER56352.1 2-polyprenyl-6-methoxyphenol hydroxylase [Streptomyces qinglanensis]
MTRTDLPHGITRTGAATLRRTALISGASIAGPALAFWLNRCGFAVTVVEKASALRGGGYPIDVRGTALEVVRRMGILPRLRDAHIDLRRLAFLDGDGGEVASIHPHTVTGGVEGRDLEVPRGDLVGALHAAVRDDVEFVFDDSVDTLDQTDHGVDVTFHGGSTRTFDLVFGADGLHSRTREFLFGPEEQFHRYLGYCFAGFTMRNAFGLSREALIWNTPGRAAVLYAVGGGSAEDSSAGGSTAGDSSAQGSSTDGDEVHAFLNFAHPEPPFEAFRNPRAQRDLVIRVFGDAGWEVPGMLAALHDADDLFFDAVSQIRMPRWSSGRVALVGDAAYAPSFLTGQGSSLALVGAYMLAASLADRDHVAGFAAYEQHTREFVTANQDLVGEGDAVLFPTSAQALDQRNAMLRNLDTMPPAEGRPAHAALTLPAFPTSG